MLERANLKHVRIVPALAQCRMREDKARRLLKGKQALLVFENQIIGRDVVGELAAALERRIHCPSGLFVNAEIALMRVRGGNAVQIGKIGRV